MQQPAQNRFRMSDIDDFDPSTFSTTTDATTRADDGGDFDGASDDGVVFLEDPGTPLGIVDGGPPVDGNDTPAGGRDAEIRSLVARAIDQTEAALIDVSLAGLRPALIQAYLGIVAELHALRDGREPAFVARNLADRRVARASPESATGDGPGLYAFTPRQSAVFDLLQTGASTRKIAAALGMAEGTVKMHLAAIYRTMRVHSRAEAIAKAR